jgi:4-amino-4-deoxy-L-arabinose transferase-like glycosyltransferase
MTPLPEALNRSWVVPSFGLAVGILGILTVVRLAGLHVSTVDLFFDEAQYWAWSREPAFGYFSKPPVLAWIIAAAEQVCGSSEACIRAPAPILYLGTSIVVFFTARQLYDETTAFFSALSLALATGAVFSARIISTDVPLLFFWALGLFAYVKIWAGAGLRWSILLGFALGFGLLAKYAMIYFVLAVALAAFLDPAARAMLRTPAPYVALAIAAVVVAPNVLWNLEHGLATLRHTGENIHGGGVRFDPLKGLEFIAAQFLVFGPVAFAVLVAAMVRLNSPLLERADRLMLAFAIPPLALVTATAFVTRALANWAATGFVSAMILVAALLVRHRAWKWLAISLIIGVAAQAIFLVGDVLATRLHLPGLANGDVYHRTLGGQALGHEAGRLARQAGARSIVTDRRDDVASLLYYWRDQPEQIFAWGSGARPDHHFELTRGLTDRTPLPILFVSRCAADARLKSYFATVEPLGNFVTPTGPTTGRTYFAFKLDGRRQASGPLGPCTGAG